MSSPAVPGGALFALAIASALACSSSDDDHDQFKEEVLWCEEAVAHLVTCCGGSFDPHQVECRFDRTGCSDTHVDPAFTRAQSECIESSSCEAIAAQGICARALAAGAARITKSNEDTSTLDASVSRAVCP